MSSESELCLLSVLLHPDDTITSAVYGSFSKPKSHELVLCRAGTHLELIRPTPTENGDTKLVTVVRTAVFASIRSVAVFKLSGGTSVDGLLITSDSGKLIAVAVQTDNNSTRFTKITEFVIGKIGMRRTLPAHYVAVDPSGRACMCAALEQRKLSFILTREHTDASAHPLSALSMSSPLEAHKSGFLTLALCALAVGYENPIFAAIEVEYAQTLQTSKQKLNGAAAVELVLYELELGLNTIIRKHAILIDSTSNCLIPVPGGADGPGGLLVASERGITYFPAESLAQSPPQNIISLLFPRRYGLDTMHKGSIITAQTRHANKSGFFMLLQTEYGDIFKVTMNLPASTPARVSSVTLSYFDTIAPATSLCVTRNAYLFAASESANSYLFHIDSLDEDPQVTVISDKDALADGAASDVILFAPHKRLTHLSLVDTLDGSAPLVDCQVIAPSKTSQDDTTGTIIALCGRGNRSSIRCLRYGLNLLELALTDLPFKPLNLFNVQMDKSTNTKYLILSFASSTIAMSAGDSVEQVSVSGLMENVHSLLVAALIDNSLLQVYAAAVRHIRVDGRQNEWRPPGKQQITLAAHNVRSLIIALSGGEIVYFELDSAGGLVDVARRDMGNDVSAIAIAPIEQEKTRSVCVAVGGFDQTVRVLSLDPALSVNPLEQLSVSSVQGQPTAICIVSMETETSSSLYLYIGLSTGIVIRSAMDSSTCALSQTRRRLVGNRSVKLFAVKVQERTAVLCTSDSAALSFITPNSFGSSHYSLMPILYTQIDAATSFSSVHCAEGLAIISGLSVRIVTFDSLYRGRSFDSASLSLDYTPRKLTIVPASKQLVVIASDQNAYSQEERSELERVVASDDSKSNGAANAKQNANGNGSVIDNQSAAIISAPHAGVGRWASVIYLLTAPSSAPSSLALSILSSVPFAPNEYAVALCATQLDGTNDTYIAVGAVTDYIIAPRSFTSAHIVLYHIDSSTAAAASTSSTSSPTSTLRLIHRTPVTDIPTGLASFHRRLVVACGSTLRLYEKGKKKLLRKCEFVSPNMMFLSVNVVGDRIVVSTLSHSVCLFAYSNDSNQFVLIADHPQPRFVTAACAIDSESVAAADKFGNLYVVRLPAYQQRQLESADAAEIERLVKSKQLAAAMTQNAVNRSAAPFELSTIANTFVGSMVTAVCKCQLSAHSHEILLATTLSGALIAFIPLTNRDEIDLLSLLQIHIRQSVATTTIGGHDHLQWRSSYWTVQSVIDGELIESFNQLNSEHQQRIAEQLNTKREHITRKIEDVRTRII